MPIKPGAVLGELAHPPDSHSRDWSVYADSLLITEYSNEPLGKKEDFDQKELVQYWLHKAEPDDIIIDALRHLRIVRGGAPERFVNPDNALAVETIIRDKVDPIPEAAYRDFILPKKPRTILESALAAYDTAASDFHDFNYGGLRSEKVRRAQVAASIIIQKYIQKAQAPQASLAEQSVAS